MRTENGAGKDGRGLARTTCRTMLVTTVWAQVILCAAALAGCESEEGIAAADDTGQGTFLHFTAGIGDGGGSGKAGVATRAIPESDSIEMLAARDTLLKKTFIYKGDNPDHIRVCNVESGAPDFDLPGGGRTYEYVCKSHNDTLPNGTIFPDTGSEEEDDSVTNNPEHWSEYDFVPYGDKGFFIRDLVDDGNNYFRFYAAYRRDFSKVASMEIEADQSDSLRFLNSDVLLALTAHNLDHYEDSIRLIFYHSLCMLDVRVTVPVYDEGKRPDDGGEDALPSGYKWDDVEMCMTDVPTGFAVASTENNSGGDLVTVVPVSDTVPEIPMYRYYVEDKGTEDGTAGHEELDDDGTSSQYRTYGFCGILPPLENLSERKLPLLRLKLKDPLTQKEEKYIYTPDPGSKTPLVLQGGQISVLRLKLPRAMKKMLVLSAEIQPWRRATGTLDMMTEPEPGQ